MGKNFWNWLLVAASLLSSASMTRANLVSLPADGFGDCTRLTPAEVERKLRAVSRRMDAAHEGLSKKVTGEPTQREQSEAVALLDQLIKWLQEQQPPIGDGPTGGTTGGGSGGNGGGMGNGGENDGGRKGKDRTIRLREADLQKFFSEMGDKMPDRYREILSAYFTRLSEGEK